MTAEICLCSWIGHAGPCMACGDGYYVAMQKDAGMCPVASMALKILVKCKMRKGPPKCRCSALTSSGPGALLMASDSTALATSPEDTVMSSPGGMVSKCWNTGVIWWSGRCHQRRRRELGKLDLGSEFSSRPWPQGLPLETSWVVGTVWWPFSCRMMRKSFRGSVLWRSREAKKFSHCTLLCCLRRERNLPLEDL